MVICVPGGIIVHYRQSAFTMKFITAQKTVVELFCLFKIHWDTNYNLCEVCIHATLSTVKSTKLYGKAGNGNGNGNEKWKWKQK